MRQPPDSHITNSAGDETGATTRKGIDMKLFKSKKRVAVIAGSSVALIGGGLAFAYWTTGGSGTGTAGTGTTNAITVNQTASSTTLVPDGSTTLSGDFTNTTNPGPVYITSITASIDAFSTQGDTNKPACTQADFELTTPTVTVGKDVPNGTNVSSWDGIVLHMKNLATNQDNCKNYSVPLTYTAS